jgi:hypothetical protein
MAKQISPAHVDATLARIEWYRASYPSIAEDREAWLSTIESETQTFEDIDALVSLWAEYSASVRTLEARARRLKESAGKIKGLVLALMKKALLTRHRLPIATLSISSRSYYSIKNIDLLPDKYWVRTVNEKLIEQDLRDGVEIPGAELVEGEPSLTIRQD